MKLFKFFLFALLPALEAAARPSREYSGETGFGPRRLARVPGRGLYPDLRSAGRPRHKYGGGYPRPSSRRHVLEAGALGIARRILRGRQELERGRTAARERHPFTDPWGGLPLARFAPLSRLKQVEVVYSGSLRPRAARFAGMRRQSRHGGGGPRGPDGRGRIFRTAGGRTRRSRRIWFSTPRSFADLSFASRDLSRRLQVGPLRRLLPHGTVRFEIPDRGAQDHARFARRAPRSPAEVRGYRKGSVGTAPGSGSGDSPARA